MYSKLFLTALLVFLASFPHRLILAQDDAAIKLEELIKNPGWSLLKNEKIIDDGKEITMLELLNAFEDNNIISEGPNEPLIRHLTIVLSCNQSKAVRQYIVLILATILECREQKGGENYSNCVDSLLENVKHIDSMITRMLNILTYFCQLLPNSTDFKQIYNALMALKLYSEYETKTFTVSWFLETEGQLNEIKIETKFQEIEQLLFFVHLQLKTFSVGHCLPVPILLRQYKIIIQQKKKFELLQKTTTKLFNTCNERFAALGFEHLDLYNIDSINIDLDILWRLLEQQQPSDKLIRICWLGEPKEVTTVLHEVAAQYGTKNLAAFQNVSLKSVSQMFYRKILVTVQTYFSGIKNKIDEGLCPPHFFTTLRNNWVELKNEHFPAIREACLSIRHPSSLEECQESFYNSLNRIRFNFIDINRPAIAAACLAVISPVILNVRQYGLMILKMLIQSMYNFLYRPLTAITDRIPPKENLFWDLLSIELVKFQTIKWPSETTETSETLKLYLENERFVDPIEVVKLLELELKTASAEFNDQEVSIDVEKPLEIVSNFTDKLMVLRKSINNVCLSNALLWNAYDFEDPILIESSKELDDSAVNKICQLSTKVIKLFDLVLHHLNLYNYQGIYTDKLILKRLVYEVGQLKRRLLKLEKSVLYYLSNAPRAENLNIRNALVLMNMYKVSSTYPMDDNVNNDFRQPSRLKRLALLITIQLENYVVRNCGAKEYTHAIINSQRYDTFGVLSQDTLSLIFEDLDSAIREMQVIRIQQTRIDDGCKVNLNEASFQRLVDRDLSPLNCIGELKIQWDGTLQSIQTIRKEVESSISPKKFAKYQILVNTSVTSIFLGYILNILLTAGQDEVNFTDDQIASILLKIKQFDSIVYPNTKADSPTYIFKVFVWCFEKNKISHAKATILKDKIERKIESYDINMTSYYSVLNSRNIISENASDDIQKTCIDPLEEFVDRWVATFEHDFYCVANYMTLIV